MKITFFSFGYKFSGIPVDNTGNEGGFVFDCRFLPNPYKEEDLKNYDGRNKKIKDYFSRFEIVDKFCDNVVSIIDMAAGNYDIRGFENLFVAFGCTGGMHRSVYCMERVENYFSVKGYKTVKFHVELEK
ncbi:MAG: ATP-binding protein [Candidatus Delongbacteria bacterium]|nr:ATP-binding protein [Candidatus Delongbacteria bacterium]